jgi:hypothetical protein
MTMSNTASKWDSAPSQPWINWNVKTPQVAPNNAELAFQLFLPGTVTVQASTSMWHKTGDLSQGQETSAVQNRSLSIDSTLVELISIRHSAVPVYMNGNYRTCHGDCDSHEIQKETNHKIHVFSQNLLLLERNFNRRNRYMVIANMNDQEVGLEEVGDLYSGGEIILDTSHTTPQNEQFVKFKTTKLKAQQAYVIKFPK